MAKVKMTLQPETAATDTMPPRPDQLPDEIDLQTLETIASILQSRPQTPTSRLAELLGKPPKAIQAARDQLQARGVAWLTDMDPHGLEWAAGVAGPTEGDLGRARLRMMLGAIQKGTLVLIAKHVSESLRNPAEGLEMKDLARLLSTVGDQLRLERHEPTSIQGEAVATQGHREAQQRLIDRLLEQRRAVEEGKHIPGIS